VRETLPEGQSQGFAYDAAGNLTFHTNFLGIVITNQYDALNRLTNKTAPGGYQVRYTYGPTGLRTSLVDASGTHTYAYDHRDRLRTNATPQGTLVYDYDDFGNLKTLASTTPGGIGLTYTYDALNRLTNAAAGGPNPSSASYTYDPVGNLETVRHGNGVTNRYHYDSLNRLTNLVAGTPTAALASFAYRLAPAGQRTNLVETVGGQSRSFTWQYDPLYRLTNEVITGASPTGTISYRYDAVGNRTNRTSTVGGITNQTFAYTANDWLMTDIYDANGNTRTNGANVFLYDAENRLTNAIVGGTSITILYDGDGHRVRKIVGATTNTYLVCRQNPTGYAQVLEERVNGNLSKVYAYGLDLIAQHDTASSSTLYFGYDGLGSTRLLTTTNATIANVFAYDAFGTLIASNASPPTDYLFTGEQRDPNLGFTYLRARYLNTGTGRFWTRDTHPGNVFDPPSLHRYTYCHADPVNSVDPSGHENLPSVLTAINMMSQQAAAYIASIPAYARLAYGAGGASLGRFIQQFGPSVQNIGRQVIESIPKIRIVEEP
jgi:RHS repeat-associated protein